MTRVAEAKSIKSAQRVFEVLEYFDADHQEASVTDICRRYGYPQSSASELLSYMVHLGYLRRGTRGRNFRLSMRVAMLGAWVEPELVRNGKLLGMMDEIADRTGCTVVVATNSRVHVRCLHVVARDDNAPHQGADLPLLKSAEGLALLLTTDRGLVRKYVHRLNADEDQDRVRFEVLAAELDASSARGYVRYSEGGEDHFSILLPTRDRGEQLSLCVRAPAGINESSVIQIIRQVVSRSLGLMSVPAALPPGEVMPRRHAGMD
ncbi:MAG: IclR family transcriptional regulator [Sphingomonas sp.]|mgnify:CR=1 FL=1|nr:IclR family transcriptional regulator [Sphingomonas sp.]|tara:strand:- start:2885 stop:3673 length:789 start_codon:yes stop_codon:yes gene_type:complete